MQATSPSYHDLITSKSPADRSNFARHVRISASVGEIVELFLILVGIGFDLEALTKWPWGLVAVMGSFIVDKDKEGLILNCVLCEPSLDEPVDEITPFVTTKQKISRRTFEISEIKLEIGEPKHLDVVLKTSVKPSLGAQVSIWQNGKSPVAARAKDLSERNVSVMQI